LRHKAHAEICERGGVEAREVHDRFAVNRVVVAAESFVKEEVSAINLIFFF
jgi:hypothetical protein